MSERNTRGVLYTCDGCGSEHYRAENDVPPIGYHGQITYAGPKTTEYWTWFACRTKCIPAAMRTAMLNGTAEELC